MRKQAKAAIVRQVGMYCRGKEVIYDAVLDPYCNSCDAPVAVEFMHQAIIKAQLPVAIFAVGLIGGKEPTHIVKQPWFDASRAHVFGQELLNASWSDYVVSKNIHHVIYASIHAEGNEVKVIHGMKLDI